MSATGQPAGKRNRTGAATRTRIIEAAIAVLGEKGFSGFTMQAVASRAEVFYGNLTHHYATRDKLVEAMLEAILERYRARFDALTASLDAALDGRIRSLVTWLIDDAVDPETAPLFLELWAMATHDPKVAGALAVLYDGAVEACMKSLGVSYSSARSRRLREALFVLGTVLEGTSAIFFTRHKNDAIYQGVRQQTIEILVPILEQRLAEALE